MTYNISDLIKKKVTEKEVHLTLDLDKINDGNEEILISKPIDLTGKFTSVGDIIKFQGILSANLKFMCSRCTDVFNYDLKIEVNEQFSHDAENKDEDIIIIDGDSINITEIVESNILMSLPIKRLCKEDCKGLCQQCGTDLNHSTCNCTDQTIDPRLAKLKDLFSND